jgi:signal peptidase I
MSQIVGHIGEFFLDIVETVVIALSIFLVIYLLLMQPHQVNGLSMVPSFQNGEYVLTDKVSYRFGNPERGDVVVFHAPAAAQCPQGTGCDFIKRVIGLPGETVSVANGEISVNGTPLREDYLPPEFETKPGAATQNGPVILGPNEYFVSGDNRPYSSDSRAWGPITKNEIVGKAFFRYLPVDKAGVIKHAEY